MQMQLVTIQWLATNHAVFHPDLISQSVLEKVIRQHVHKVELSHLADMNDPKMVYPRTSKLYAKKEPSDKFILILEGRAIVTIGQVSNVSKVLSLLYNQKFTRLKFYLARRRFFVVIKN